MNGRVSTQTQKWFIGFKYGNCFPTEAVRTKKDLGKSFFGWQFFPTLPTYLIHSINIYLVNNELN